MRSLHIEELTAVKRTQAPELTSLQRLKWLTIVLAITFLVCLQGISMGLVMPNLGKIYGHALSVAGFVAGVIVFTFIMFRAIDEMQAKVLRQNDDLAALNAVSRGVAGSLRIGRTMDQALGNVMKITQAIAGEIAIESAGTEEPNRFVVGSLDDLTTLGQMASEGAPATVGSRAGADSSLRIVAIPLIGQGREIGAIRLLVTGDMPLGRRDGGDLIAAIGAQIAMAVMAGQLHEDVLRRERNLQILYEIAVEITSMQGDQGVLWSVAERAREVLRGDAAAVSLFDSTGRGITLAAHAGRPETFRSPHLAGAWFPKEARELGQASGDGNGCPLDDPSFSRHCAPLHVGSHSIGELCVAAVAPRQFSDEEQHLLSGLADLAAIAVQKSRLMEQERQVAVLEERERLAREMHDSLAQVLGYLHLKSETALRRLSVNDIAKAQDDLREMATLAREAYADVREAIMGLRDSVLRRRGFVDALREYTLKFSQQAGVPTQLEMRGRETLELAPDAEVQLIRVIQEALTNVRKHACARKACVRVDHQDGGLRITIEDDGKGFDPGALDNDRDRFGLFTMRERVERVGGRLEIDSVIGRGTRVCVIFSDAEVK